MPHRNIENAVSVIDTLWHEAGCPDVDHMTFCGVHVLTALPKRDGAKLLAALAKLSGYEHVWFGGVAPCCGACAEPHPAWGEGESRVYGADKE